MTVNTTPPPSNPTHEDIVWLTGPRLIAILFNWSLLGLLTAQVYVFYLNFPRERRTIKALVYVLYVLDWAQTCSATYDAFQWFVYGFGNISDLYNVYTDYLNVPVLSGTIAAMVQIFFGWRIWKFSRSLTAFFVIISLALLQLGGGLSAAYFLYINPSEVSRSQGLVRSVAVRLGSSAVVDAVIASTMTYFLLQTREEITPRMDTIVTRLIRGTVETGTLTAFMAVLDLVFFLTEHNALHQVSGVTLGKLYTNTLLVILNNRLMMQNLASQPLSLDLHLSGTDSEESRGSVPYVVKSGCLVTGWTWWRARPLLDTEKNHITRSSDRNAQRR